MPKSKEKNSVKTYTISDLAAEFEISSRTIRFYEEKGLISPERTKGNQRKYSRRDRARLKLILRGKRFGYSLDEIAEMIGMTDVNMSEAEQIEKSLAYGEKKLVEIREQIRELEFLEEDILSVKKKLLKSLAKFKK
jgi:DNA-binding transcriptional MerR regulator